MHREVLMCEASSRPPSVGKSNQAIPRPHIQLKHHSSGKHNGDGGCDQPGPESESALKTYEKDGAAFYSNIHQWANKFFEMILSMIFILNIIEYQWISFNEPVMNVLNEYWISLNTYLEGDPLHRSPKKQPPQQQALPTT